jgi:Uma2 family endonuclease
MEIVSGSREDRIRDWRTKSREYAAAGIPEYWIVDPDKMVIRVLTLRGKTYRRHGDFKPGQSATSVLLPGFKVAVDDVFAAGDQ